MKILLSISQLITARKYKVFGPENVKVYPSLKLIGEPIIEEYRVESIYMMHAGSMYVDKTRRNG